MKKYKNGFTMMEMLVVISIIGVLMAMLFPAIAKVRQNVKIGAAKKDIQKMTMALTNFMADFGYYPPESFNTAGRVSLGASPDGSPHADGTPQFHIDLSETFLYCLSTKNKKGPYFDIPIKSRVNVDGDYFNSGSDTMNSAWNDGSKVYLYEFLDPWGNPYRYFRTQPTSNTVTEGKGFDFWLVSNGPDGKPGFAVGSKEKPDGDDDGNAPADAIDGSEDGYRVLYSGKYVYSDDIVNWR